MKCTIGQGRPQPKLTDTQLLNWLESQGRPRLKWAVFFGFGEIASPYIQQVTAKMTEVIGPERCFKTLREAITGCIALEFERSQKAAAEELTHVDES